MFFWNALSFSMIQRMLAIWFLFLPHFLNPACTSGSSQFMNCWSLVWKIWIITLLIYEMSTITLCWCWYWEGQMMWMAWGWHMTQNRRTTWFHGISMDWGPRFSRMPGSLIALLMSLLGYRAGASVSFKDQSECMQNACLALAVRTCFSCYYSFPRSASHHLRANSCQGTSFCFDCEPSGVLYLNS